MKNSPEIDVQFPKGKIRVEKDVIDKACRANSRHCMIAEAIRDQIKGATNISVDLMTIRYSDPKKGLRYTFHTPRVAQKALVEFDMGRPVPAFVFQLKGGQATSMVHQDKQIHSLGRRKNHVTKEANGGIVVDVVGGKSPPKLNPKHPSHQTIRQFGLAGFTKGWTEQLQAWTGSNPLR
jgi:hypothetical protein